MDVESPSPARAFDLNVEKILEDWEVYDAIREVIANALDEQLITHTKDIEISKDASGCWHIRDFGRGLRYQHLTQKENEEKLKTPGVIGKFGIGLKDALATFERHGVKVTIKSRYGDITLGMSKKHGFEDLLTLHAFIAPPSDPEFEGTEFILEGVTDKDIEKAKDLFLKFSGEQPIESTKYGQVLAKKEQVARIYINGVKVAEEENFLFSYNITSLNQAIRKALNRERSNVGRAAYSGRVKDILLACNDSRIAEALVRDLENFGKGTTHDELKWTDVQVHAAKILNSKEKVVFLTPDEIIREADMVDEAKASGYKIVTIPDNLADLIRGDVDTKGEPMRELKEFIHEYNEGFEFKFVKPENLSPTEKEVFNKTQAILDLIGGKPKEVKEIKISETMIKDPNSFKEADGVCNVRTGIIIIKRSTLESLAKYAGTLLHEVGHVERGAPDLTRDFEDELTDLIGRICSRALR